MKAPVIFATNVEFIDHFGFTAIRGSMVHGVFADEPVEVKCPGYEAGIVIEREGFKPSRPGVQGKRLASLMIEGNWIAQSNILPQINGHFLFPSEENMVERDYDVSELRSELNSVVPTANLVDYPVPVYLRFQPDVFGVLIAKDEGTALLKLLESPEAEQQSGHIELELVADRFHQGLAFSGSVAVLKS